MYEIGQALWGKLRFVDGKMPNYKRPFLIVDIKDDKIGVVNASSIDGKERKLDFPYNVEVKDFQPPFKERSMVKLDSFTYFTIQECQKCSLMSNGEKLNSDDLNNIISQLNIEMKL